MLPWAGRGRRSTKMEGPGNWFIPDDAYYVSYCYGQHRAVASLGHVSWAAKCRVGFNEIPDRKAFVAGFTEVETMLQSLLPTERGRCSLM